MGEGGEWDKAADIGDIDCGSGSGSDNENDVDLELDESLSHGTGDGPNPASDDPAIALLPIRSDTGKPAATTKGKRKVVKRKSKG